jgi:hypothetical protein
MGLAFAFRVGEGESQRFHVVIFKTIHLNLNFISPHFIF